MNHMVINVALQEGKCEMGIAWFSQLPQSEIEVGLDPSCYLPLPEFEETDST